MTESRGTVTGLAARRTQGGHVSIDRALDAARASLDTIDREGPWAYSDGYWPECRSDRATVRPDGPAGATATSADDVPGEKWDTGIGNYRARQAFRSAITHLAQADDRLADVLWLAHVTRQPILAIRPCPLTASELRLRCRVVRWRLTKLEELYQSTDRDFRRLARGVLEGTNVAVLTLLDRAALELAGAMQAGARDALGPVIAMCRYGCGRPAGLKKGGKCDACHQADHRGRGPAVRVGARAEREELRRTHARHRARGHGFGYD